MEMEKMQELMFALARMSDDIDSKISQLNGLRYQAAELEEDIRKMMTSINEVKAEIDMLRYSVH